MNDNPAALEHLHSRMYSENKLTPEHITAGWIVEGEVSFGISHGRPDGLDIYGVVVVPWSDLCKAFLTMQEAADYVEELIANG